MQSLAQEKHLTLTNLPYVSLGGRSENSESHACTVPVEGKVRKAIHQSALESGKHTTHVVGPWHASNSAPLYEGGCYVARRKAKFKQKYQLNWPDV